MNSNTIKSNCFAYDDKNMKCKACKDLKCAKCAFYKKNKDDTKQLKFKERIQKK